MDLITEKVRATELEAKEEEFFKVAVGKLKKNKEMLKDKKFEEKMNNAKFHKLVYRIMVSVSSDD